MAVIAGPWGYGETHRRWSEGGGREDSVSVSVLVLVSSSPPPAATRPVPRSPHSAPDAGCSLPPPRAAPPPPRDEPSSSSESPTTTTGTSIRKGHSHILPTSNSTSLLPRAQGDVRRGARVREERAGGRRGGLLLVAAAAAATASFRPLFPLVRLPYSPLPAPDQHASGSALGVVVVLVDERVAEAGIVSKG